MMNLIKAVLVVTSVYWMLTVDITTPLSMVLPLIVAVTVLALHKVV
jgi:hypothetical protein